jgi:hypothetical protein
MDRDVVMERVRDMAAGLCVAGVTVVLRPRDKKPKPVCIEFELTGDTVRGRMIEVAVRHGEAGGPIPPPCAGMRCPAF